MPKTVGEPTSLCGLRCLGFLAFVAFALLVATAVVLGIDGASIGAIILAAVGAVAACFCFVCTCWFLPDQERAGRAYD